MAVYGNNIPTAAFAEFTTAKEALAYLDTVSAPIVVKADGLAAGTTPGRALGFNYLYDTRDLNISFSFYDISNDFETATGYLTRPGVAGIVAGDRLEDQAAG